MTDVRTFLVKHVGPGFLAGITTSDWWRLLAANRFRISPQHLGRAVTITLSTPMTSVLKPLESAIFGGAIRKTTQPDPIFVLGSWRSGTTYLHSLLNVDPRFGCPTLYETMHPYAFLLTESWWRPVLELGVPKTRFMDNMKMSLAEPHEDEMALAVMTQRSNMLSWIFPSRAEFYDRFLSFEEASEADLSSWKNALKFFVQKIAYKTGRHVVLKSPNHTARIRMILEVFPKAKFLHIRRHPYDVYRSFCHMAANVIPMWGLEAYRLNRIPRMVIRTYAELYDAFFDQVSLIPPGQFFEVKYEDLVTDPVQHVAAAYESLGLPDFNEVRPKLEAFISGQKDYQKNRHAELDADVRAKLAEKWARCFAAWDYEQS